MSTGAAAGCRDKEAGAYRYQRHPPENDLVPTNNLIRCQLWETDLDNVEIRKIDKSASRV